MSADGSVAACEDDSTEISVFERELVLSQDEDEQIGGQDVLLGSLLEHELNRSIEKLRELEKTMAMPNLDVGMLTEGTSYSPLNTQSELLDDIEMPSFSDSNSEIADLVSLSSTSPYSPMKSKATLERTNSSYCNPVRKAGDSNPVRKWDGSVSFRVPAAVCSKEETDLAAFTELSGTHTPKVTRLISVNEIGSHSSESSSASKSSEEYSRKCSFSTSLYPKEKSANITSSPVSPSCRPSLFGRGLLDVDDLNDSLISSLIMESAPGPDLEDCADVVENEKERLRKLCEELKANKIDHEVCNREDVTDLISPSHRMTLGGACTALDMEDMNDSLLASFQMAKSPFEEPDFDFPLPTPLKEYKKKLLREQESLANNAKSWAPVGDNDFKLLEKLVNETQSVDKLLDETHNILNKSKSLNDVPKAVDAVAPVDRTFSSLDKLLDNKDCTFVQGLKNVLNATFSPVGKSKAPMSLGSKINRADGTKAENHNANTTFDKAEQIVNQTFSGISDGVANAPLGGRQGDAANTTFDFKKSKVTSDKEVKQNPVEDGESNNEDNGEKLNVTFEKGEYKIPSLNETVNLMDAEGDVLKLILDSTPKKSSKVHPEAASTPKTGGISEPASSTITKDPSKSFLHRMSLGMRRTALNATIDKPQDATSGQQPNLSTAVPGFKMGYLKQSVPSQFRRMPPGPSGRPHNGPMRALPLVGMSVEGSSDMQKDNMTPDEMEGIKALDSTSTPEEMRKALFPKDCVRSVLPSFGSCSSIENERSSTPDILPSSGIMTSTPDVFRPGCLNMNPRITSTPAARVIPLSNVVGIDGALPTPITAPSSRSRFATINSTTSLPENHDNPSLGSIAKESKLTSNKCDFQTPAKKCLEIPIGEIKTSSVTGASAIIPEEAKHPVYAPEPAFAGNSIPNQVQKPPLDEEDLSSKNIKSADKLNETNGVTPDSRCETGGEKQEGINCDKQVLEQEGTSHVKQISEQEGTSCVKQVLEEEGTNCVKQVSEQEGTSCVKQVLEQEGTSCVKQVSEQEGTSCIKQVSEQEGTNCVGDVLSGERDVMNENQNPNLEAGNLDIDHNETECELIKDNMNGVLSEEIIPKIVMETSVLDNKIFVSKENEGIHSHIPQASEASVRDESLSTKGKENPLSDDKVSVSEEDENIQISHMPQAEAVLNNSCSHLSSQPPLTEEINSNDNANGSNMKQLKEKSPAGADEPLHREAVPATPALNGTLTLQGGEGDQITVKENKALDTTRVVDQPNLKQLSNSNAVMKKEDEKEKRKPSSSSKIISANRRSTSTKSNTLSKGTRPSLSAKQTAVANKENTENVKSNGPSKVNSFPKALNRTRSHTVGVKLPTLQANVTPSKSLMKKVETKSSGSGILKESNASQNSKGTPSAVPNRQILQAKAPLGKKCVDANPLKLRGLKPPGIKGKEPSSDKSNNVISRLQPPSRSSIQPPANSKLPSQPAVNSKLPLGPRSHSSIPLKGYVKSQGSSDSLGSTSSSSKLPGIRPPTQSRLPNLPQTSTNKANTRSIPRIPSKLLRPNKV